MAVNVEVGLVVSKKGVEAVPALARDLDTLAGAAARTGQTLSTFGVVLSAGVTAPLMAAASTAAIAAIGYESAFASVAKTVNATDQELAGLSASFRQMATEIPVSAAALAQIGASAGQLGVPVKDIKEFARVIADLGVATDLTAEEGAQSLAQLANVTKMPKDQFDNLGSVIVGLGNRMATTESKIVSMSMRIAGAGATVGMSNAQIMGIAASLSSVGIEAEAGGSAISKIMIDMAAAVSSGGDQLQKFAAVSGLSSSQFAAAWKADAGGALTAFVEGLARMRDSGGDVIGTLTNLGIEEVRMRQAMLGLANAGDLFGRSLRIANDEWTKNTALSKEAQARYATTESQLKILGNRFWDIAITVGNSLLPAIRLSVDLLGSIVPYVAAAAEAFGRLPAGFQLAAVGVAAIAVAAGPTLIAIGKIITIAGEARIALAALGAAQAAAGAASGAGAAAGAAGVAGGAVAGIGGALSATAGVASTAATSIAAVATSTAALTVGAAAATGAVSAGLTRSLVEAGDASRGTADDISKGIEQVSLLSGAATIAGDVFGAVGGAFAQLGAWIAKTSVTIGSAIVSGLATAGKQLWAAFGGPLEVMWRNLGESAAWLSQQIGYLGRDFYGTGVSARQAATDTDILARASALAGRDITDMGVALRVVANANKGMPVQFASSADATRKWNAELAASKKALDDLARAKTGGPVAPAPPTTMSDADIKKLLEGKKAADDLKRAQDLVGSSSINAATAQRVLAISAQMGAAGHKAAESAARAHDQALGALGLSGAKTAGEMKAIEAALVSIGGAASLSRESVMSAGQQLLEAAQGGATLGAEAEKVVDRFLDFQIAATTAEQTAAAMTELSKAAAETANAYQALVIETQTWERAGAAAGPGVAAGFALVNRQLTGAAAVLPRLAQILAGVGAAGGFDALGADQLEQVTKDLRELEEASRKTGANVVGVAVALDAATAAGQKIATETAPAFVEVETATRDWGAAVEQVARLMELLGVSADSGLGRVVGGFTGAFAGLDAFKKGIGEFATKDLMKGGLTGLVSGIGGALAAGKAALGVGKAIVGLFRQSPAEKAAKEAGRTLGVSVSKELAETIAKTSTSLKIDMKTASLLNLDKAIAESGKPITAFQSQVSSLFGLLSKGGAVAAASIKQIGSAFLEAQKAAQAGDQAARRMMASMAQQARATGAQVPEIADAVKAGLDKAFGGLGALIKGIPIMSSRDVDSQAVLLMSGFWAKVKEGGIIEAGLAFADAFKVWNDKLDAAGQEMSDTAAQMLAPFNVIGRLAADESMRPLLEGIQGGRDFLAGMADTGYATVGMFSALGQTAQTSYDALIAKGADSQTALTAVAPLLADLKQAADMYGVTLDANTQSLLAQAEAAGVAFPTDPLLQIVDLLQSINVAVGGQLPASARASSAAFDAMGGAGSAAFAKLDGRASATADAIGASVVTATGVAGAAVEGFVSVAASSYNTLGLYAEQAAGSVANAWRSTNDSILGGIQALSERRITIPVSYALEGGLPPVPELAPGSTAPDMPAFAAPRAPTTPVVAGAQQTVGSTTYSFHVTLNVSTGSAPGASAATLEDQIRAIIRRGGPLEATLRSLMRNEARMA